MNPRGTSHICPVCGTKKKANRPERNLFKCVSCEFAGPSDYIAAINIAARANVVNEPIVACYDAEAVLNGIEVKSPSVRKGRHKAECVIPISEDERKFGEVFGKNYVFVIIFNEQRYDIPFVDLQERIMRNKISQSLLGGTVRQKRIISLGKSFLSKYQTSLG